MRSPVEFVVSCIRGTGSTVAESNPRWWLPAMGQELFDPPGPKGWDANDFWLSATATWAKADFASYVSWNAVARDWLGEIAELSVPAAVSLTLDTFGVDTASAGTITALEDYVIAERAALIWPEHHHLMMLTMLTPEHQRT